MKNILALVLMVFGLVGCGYEDKNECLLKEQQKCDGGCRAEAYTYCEAKFPSAASDWKPTPLEPLSKKYKNYKECVNGEYEPLAEIVGESQQLKFSQEMRCKDAFFE